MIHFSPKTQLYSMICVAVFLDTLLYGIIVPAVPYYVAWLGTDTAELGIIFAAYSVGVLLTSIPAGILCDRIGHKKVLLLGQAGLGLATAAFILSGSVAALTISRFLQGVASATTWTAGLALATELFPSAERGKKLGLVMSAAGFGTIAGPIFGGVLFDRLGYTYPFVAVAILAGILLVWIPSIPVETAPGAFEAHNKAPSSRSPLRDAFKNTNLLWGSVTVATGSFGFGVLDPLLPLHVSQRFDLASQGIGVLFGIMGLTHTLSQPLLGTVSDRIGRKRVMVAGLLATAAAAPLIAIAPSLLTLYAATALFGLTAAMIFIPCLPLMAESTGENASEISGSSGQNSYGTAFGLLNTAYSLGLAGGPIAGGLLTSRYGFSCSLLLYSVILLAAAAGVLLKVKETLKVKSPGV